MADKKENNNSGISEDQKQLEQSLDKTYDLLLTDTTNEMGKFVNILTQYTWSANKWNTSMQGDYKFLPCAYVHEYRQNLDTFVASMEYYLHGTAGSIPFTGGTIQDGIKKIENITSNRSNKFNTILETSTFLAPYKFMYSLDDENCSNYVFPYFENDFVNISNTYSDEPQISMATATQANNFFADNLARWTGYTDSFMSAVSGGGDGKSPTWDNNGVFVEKPKYFQFNATGETITVKFPLYNTVYTQPNSDENWKKNYKFIKNFALKNLPYKVSMFRYKTPLLYEISVPGVKYFPVSYISNFTATMRGTRRFLNLDGDRVIIPDAWDIMITFTSLLGRSANIFKQITEKGPEIYLERSRSSSSIF